MQLKGGDLNEQKGNQHSMQSRNGDLFNRDCFRGYLNEAGNRMLDNIFNRTIRPHAS